MRTVDYQHEHKSIKGDQCFSPVIANSVSQVLLLLAHSNAYCSNMLIIAYIVTQDAVRLELLRSVIRQEDHLISVTSVCVILLP